MRIVVWRAHVSKESIASGLSFILILASFIVASLFFAVDAKFRSSQLATIKAREHKTANTKQHRTANYATQERKKRALFD